MSIKSAMSSHFKANAGVSALVGTKVFQGLAPQTTALPYITITRFDPDRKRHLKAASGILKDVVQVDCWADSPNGADALAETVRESLDHILNTTIGTTPYNMLIQNAQLQGQVDDFEPSSEGTPDGTHSVKMTWHVWHTESVPTFA